LALKKINTVQVQSALNTLRLFIALAGMAAALQIFPLVLALARGEAEMVRTFLWIIVPILVIALPVTLIPGRIKIAISPAQGFRFVFLVWLVFCLVGCLPFLVSGREANFSRALFEAVSGYTTTGATVFKDVESLPMSLNLWRAMTHWFGGLGIILLTVALAPFLGAGAFQLLKAETAGPDKARWTPKITTQAKILWLVYTGLTVLEIILLKIAGMPLFDSVFHAFSTMGTGGFSCRNNSIMSYHSSVIEWICIVFMFLGGFNFTLIWQGLRLKFGEIAENSEAKAYISIYLCAAALVAAAIFPVLDAGKNLPLLTQIHDAIRTGLFHVISIMSTTGFMAEDHSAWPALAQCALFMVMFIGGSSGSTAGGVKVIRFVIAGKQALNELKKMVYPQGVFLIHINGRPGQKDVVGGVAAFMFGYFLLLLGGALLVASAGYNIWDSANASLIMLGNIGLGVGKLTEGALFITCPDYVRYGLSFLMITGRLELLTVLVLFTKDIWRQK
jgi:trk system potassium uptake protein TrkH